MSSDETLPACYALMNGTNLYQRHEDSPCGNSDSGVSVCCQKGDVCTENGICHFTAQVPGTSGYYTGGCTDPTFKDPACPKQCSESPARIHARRSRQAKVTHRADRTFSLPVKFQSQDIQWNSTSGLWACCYNDTGDPVDCAHPGNTTFQASPQPSLSVAGIAPGFVTPVPTASSSSSSSVAPSSTSHSSFPPTFHGPTSDQSPSPSSPAAPTSPAASTSPSHSPNLLNTTTIATISVISALLFLAIIIFLFLLRRRHSHKKALLAFDSQKQAISRPSFDHHHHHHQQSPTLAAYDNPNNWPHNPLSSAAYPSSNWPHTHTPIYSPSAASANHNYNLNEFNYATQLQQQGEISPYAQTYVSPLQRRPSELGTNAWYGDEKRGRRSKPPVAISELDCGGEWQMELDGRLKRSGRNSRVREAECRDKKLPAVRPEEEEKRGKMEKEGGIKEGWERKRDGMEEGEDDNEGKEEEGGYI